MSLGECYSGIVYIIEVGGMEFDCSQEKAEGVILESDATTSSSVCLPSRTCKYNNGDTVALEYAWSLIQLQVRTVVLYDQTTGCK